MPTHHWGFLPQEHWTLPPYTMSPPALTEEKQHLLHEGFLHLIHKEKVSSFLLLVDAATGLDALAVLISLRTAYPLHITALLPYEEQHTHWAEETQERYFHFLPLCDTVITLAPKASPSRFRDASLFIIKHCKHLLTYWDGLEPNLGDSLNKAKSSGKELYVLTPEELFP